jgi:hypothetical protein
MLVAKTYNEGERDLTDPQQVRRTIYAFNYDDPTGSGWQMRFFNRVPDAGSLKGLGRALGNLSWSALPTWAQIAVVGLTSAGAGYFAMSRFGDSHIKPALRKIGIGR